MDYSLSLDRVAASSNYQITREELAYLPSLDTREVIKLAARSQNEAKIFLDGQWKALEIQRLNGESLLSAFTTSLAIPDVIRICREQIASWQVYHQFSTSRESPVRQPPVASIAKEVSSDGSNLIQVLHTLYSDRGFERDLDLAMRAAFGEDFDKIIFPPAADQRIQLRVRWKSLKREQSTGDLPDGMLRFLYLIAILANPEPPALIAIDEPETGLHPSMMRIIAEFAAEAALRTQVIFTTHSAEFLNAFDQPPVTTVARWEEGRTILQTISDEALQYWLKEYTLGKLYLTGELEGMA
jgi:predicted ATPase